MPAAFDSITRITLAFSVEIPEMLFILEKDKRVESTLHDRLLKHPEVFACDYDGHFGAYVFVDFGGEVSEKTRKQVITIINTYLKGMKKGVA